MDIFFGTVGASAFAISLVINEAIRDTPGVSNAYSPIINALVGLAIGILVGVSEPQYLKLDIAAGVVGSGVIPILDIIRDYKRR